MSRILICPYCGKRFSLTYSRAFECTGCRQATFGECGYARCPSCKKEFKI
ncbi:MAG: hypothetical protein NZ922_06045 [Candidatus Methanomethyliaceae archaeon]|nr:hypothetical protein [Candidatus Methanomethyliaceae archaeon]MDW7971275.1 hypothetical protein [Nitrososphaerota archaeon]